MTVDPATLRALAEDRAPAPSAEDAASISALDTYRAEATLAGAHEALSAQLAELHALRSILPPDIELTYWRLHRVLDELGTWHAWLDGEIQTRTVRAAQAALRAP